MAENESGQDKTEQATPKKLEQLMESGQFARSREVITLVLIMGAMLVLTMMAPKMVETFQLFMTSIYQQLGTLRMTPETFVGYYRHFMLTAGTLILPVMLMALFAGLLSAGAQSGMRVSPKAIEPKFSKLSPWSGFKRMFSSQSGANWLPPFEAMTQGLPLCIRYSSGTDLTRWEIRPWVLRSKKLTPPRPDTKWPLSKTYSHLWTLLTM